MSEEIKERPDSPGIWQCSNGKLIVALLVNGELHWTDYPIGIVFDLPVVAPTGDCRLIVDADGKQICDPQSPWPTEPKVDKTTMKAPLANVVNAAWVRDMADCVLKNGSFTLSLHDVPRLKEIMSTLIPPTATKVEDVELFQSLCPASYRSIGKQLCEVDEAGRVIRVLPVGESK